jgi:radical SAM superfamily enzyme YgiQ (UPF0313 family)
VVLLLSTYDLGRQPFGLASPAAWLRRAGVEVSAIDLSRDKLAPEMLARARLVAVYLPMHTATRLAIPVIDRVRGANPDAVICAYGLYAPLNEALLRAHGVTQVLGPEFEQDLVKLASDLCGPLRTYANLPGRLRFRYGEPADQPPLKLRRSAGASAKAEALATAGPPRTSPALPRLSFIPPDRSGLAAPARYASVQMPDGTRRIAGSTDATRGCKHRCRHCPIVPVYDGQFRVVPADVVLTDIRAQVAEGVQHVTFADPDFLNGPTHARRIVEALHAEWPALTYDVTIKVEHLVGHRDLLPVLASTGCLFVTSAVESVDDNVLLHLDKGHTRADFMDAVALCRAAGLTLAPTFVAFTPWTTIAGYADLLDTIADLDLVPNVSPVQWGIRLLVTLNSRLLELEDIRRVVGPFDSRTLTYPWTHPDPRVDTLQAAILKEVGVRITRPRGEIFERVRRLAGDPDQPPPRLRRSAEAIAKAEGSPLRVGNPSGLPARATIPYLNEPWYC